MKHTSSLHTKKPFQGKGKVKTWWLERQIEPPTPGTADPASIAANASSSARLRLQGNEDVHKYKDDQVFQCSVKYIAGKTTGNSGATSAVSATSPATVPEATERPEVEEEESVVTVSETTELLPTTRKGQMAPSPLSALICQHNS